MKDLKVGAVIGHDMGIFKLVSSYDAEKDGYYYVDIEEYGEPGDGRIGFIHREALIKGEYFLFN